jgi:hypothetical protein
MRLQQTLDGWRHEDPPTQKKLPVESDVPEYLVNKTGHKAATALDQAIADLMTTAFYYLLHVGEYTVKRNRNKTKRTVEFKMEDITFFKKENNGHLRCLLQNAKLADIMLADGATLKLDNQKNGWKGVCIYQQTMGDPFHCPVRAAGCQFAHLSEHHATGKTCICAYWIDDTEYYVTAENISAAVKRAAAALSYPMCKGISIDWVDTHSLRIGGARVLTLSGYSDMHIQKMGRWRGETFKEYVREELHCFLDGMAKDMKQCFHFANVMGHVFHDIPLDTLSSVLNPANDQ